jgi:hypothetical protein
VIAGFEPLDILFSVAMICRQLKEQREHHEQEVARLKAMKYAVILGSFKVPSNADNYLNVVKGMGYDAQIITAPRGWNLVCAVAFEKRREAFRKARELQDAGQDAREFPAGFLEEIPLRTGPLFPSSYLHRGPAPGAGGIPVGVPLVIPLVPASLTLQYHRALCMYVYIC